MKTQTRVFISLHKLQLKLAIIVIKPGVVKLSWFYIVFKFLPKQFLQLFYDENIQMLLSENQMMNFFTIIHITCVVWISTVATMYLVFKYLKFKRLENLRIKFVTRSDHREAVFLTIEEMYL